MSGILTAIASGQYGSTGVTYFFSERFEGTGYQNTWDETGSTGTVDEDYTVSPLEGSQSLRLATSTQHPRTMVVLPSDQVELWCFFRLRVNVALAANRPIFNLLDSGGASLVSVNLTTTNTLFAGFGGSSATATTDALVTGTNYNIWFHAKKGTGANGVGSVGFSTSGTEVTSGTAYSSKTNAANTADHHALLVAITTTSNTNTVSGEIVMDQILISTTGTIGNSPA